MRNCRTFCGGMWLSAVVLVVVSCLTDAWAGYVREFDLPIPALDAPRREEEIGRMDPAVFQIAEDVIIEDLDVHIGLTHGSLMDLDIVLESPAGTTVRLSEWGNERLLDFSGTHTMVFDDSAGVSIENAVAGFNGPYRPMEGLSAFEGENVQGVWRLMISDEIRCDTGVLHRVELVVNVPEPASGILLGLAGVMVLRRVRTDD